MHGSIFGFSPPVISQLQRAMGAFAVLHPRYRPFVTNSFTHDFCDW